MESIALPSTVQKIGSSAFRCCSNLTKIVLNDGLVSIGKGLLQECESLESITIPPSVNEISYFAFGCCTSLQEVVLNGRIKKIGEAAFYQCRSLQSINLPHIEVIGKTSFKGCRSLREVGLNEETEEIGKDAFEECPLLQRFALPHLSLRLEAIMQDSRWEEIRNKIDNINGVHIQGSELFIERTVFESAQWKDRIDTVIAHISYPEMKAATTLFELALWKARIDQRLETNRSKCRVDVPGPVKDAIVQYLWPKLATTHTLWRNE